MDYQLLALIGVMVAVIVIGIKLKIWWWPARPGYEYQRVFSAAAAGLLLLVAGLIGWELRRSHGFFEGTTWVQGPIWWQVAAGIGLLLLAGFWAKRVPPRPTPR
jgi:hypothetical protein